VFRALEATFLDFEKIGNDTWENQLFVKVLFFDTCKKYLTFDEGKNHYLTDSLVA